MPASYSSKTKGSTLCKYCECVVFGEQTWVSIWRTASPDATSISHDFTRQQLYASVIGGCRFCQYLLSNVQPDTYGKSLSISFSLSGPDGVKPRKINCVRVQVTGLPQYARRLLYVSIFAKPGSIPSALVRAVDHLDRAKPNFDPCLARSWIQNCKSYHTSSSCHNVPNQLPTRVLDVSNFVSGSIPLRTMPTESHEPYAALSYCWGKSKPLMTTKATLNVHQDGMQLQDMPKTYRDAVFVAFKLNIKYLWIDALCIVQDCDIDKAYELSRMKRYYENADIMVAASNAHSADDGFLNSNKPLNSDTSSKYSGNGFENGSRCFGVPCYPFSSLRDTVYLDTAPIRYEALEEPLNQRAWTYQEWLLCRRALVFPSMGGFFLHCHEEKRHDDSIDFGEPFGTSNIFSPPSFMSTPEDTEETTISKAWFMHTREYSERQITHLADKAVAIAGIAEAYSVRASAHLGDYVAGHWSKHLMTSLHWRVFPGEAKEAIRPIRPHSWSWLSVTGPIQLQPYVMIMQQHLDLGKVRNVTVRHVSNVLPFGAVDYGRLTIQACLGKAIWMPPGPRSKLPSLRTDKSKGDLNAKTFADTLDDIPIKPTPVILLPLCVGAGQTLNGLLLRRTEYTEESVFRRIGYFEFVSSTFLGTCTSVRLINIV